MSIIKHAVAVFIFTLLIGLSLHAESLSGIGEIEQWALENNIEYKTAVLEIVKAYNNLEYFFTAGDSSLTLTGSYSTQQLSPEFQAAVSLPLFEQLSLSASANQDLESSLGFSLSPLSHSDNIKQTQLNYNSAAASAKATAEEVKTAAVEDYLNWAAALNAMETAEKTADIKKIIYEDEKIRMDNGEAVLEDVREAFIEWSSARSAYNAAVTLRQQTETDLYSTLNADSAEITIIPPKTQDILTDISELSASINAEALTITESWEVISASIQTESLKSQLDSTWYFEPAVNFGGTVNLSSGAAPEFSATLSLTAGLNDFNGTEIDELQTELKLSREQEALTAANQRLKLRQSVTAAETSRLNYEKAEVELTQAEELYREAEFLFKLGEYSAAELEESRLELETSRNSLFSAAADEYTALRTLSSFLP